jgi:hypothetical protein
MHNSVTNLCAGTKVFKKLAEIKDVRAFDAYYTPGMRILMRKVVAARCSAKKGKGNALSCFAWLLPVQVVNVSAFVHIHVPTLAIFMQCHPILLAQTHSPHMRFIVMAFVLFAAVLAVAVRGHRRRQPRATGLAICSSDSPFEQALVRRGSYF